ncbi:MAG: CBS domain-containing protein [Pseudomonadota bacterium]
MPGSYQAPMRKDKQSQRTYSQSQASNLSSEQASVARILKQKGSDIFSISPGDTLGRAVEILRDRRIGALVVTDEGGALVGILSERDIVRKLADTPGKTLPQLVKDVMTKKVETCSSDEPLITVLRRMTAGRFRHMPAVEGSKLVGMVTIGDVISFRLTELEQETLQLKQLIVG